MKAKVQDRLLHDQELARRVAEGDTGALRIIYDRYAEPLFSFIYHRMDEARQDAEEIWQTTLLAGLQGIHSFRGQSTIFTWLCGIAKHKIADFCGRNQSRVEPFADVPSASLSEAISSGPLPEELLHQRATQTLVVRALAELPEHYRLALVARYVDELGVEEVSRKLGRTYKATESLLSRARAAFRQAVQNLEEAADER